MKKLFILFVIGMTSMPGAHASEKNPGLFGKWGVPVTIGALLAGAALAGMAFDKATTPDAGTPLGMSPASANLTDLQAHVLFFKDRAQVNPHAILEQPLRTREMTKRGRELGLTLPEAAKVAVFSNALIGGLTRGCPMTGIDMAQITKGMHGPVHSGIFDQNGVFNETAFRRLFKDYAGGRKFITRSELQKMTDDRHAEVAKQYSVLSPSYWWYKMARIGSNGEWDVLLQVNGYKRAGEPAIRRTDLRRFFVNASRLYELREAFAQAHGA